MGDNFLANLTIKKFNPIILLLNCKLADHKGEVLWHNKSYKKCVKKVNFSEQVFISFKFTVENYISGRSFKIAYSAIVHYI